MATLVQSADLIEVPLTAWYPILNPAERASDGATLLHVDWGGGDGAKPPAGYIRTTGSPTSNPADGWALNVLHTTDSGLTPQERITLDGAVQFDSIELNGSDLSYADSGGQAHSIALPDAFDAATLNITPDNQLVLRYLHNGIHEELSVALPHTAPPSTPGGVTIAQVDGRITALVKGYAVAGGPKMQPTTELDQPTNPFAGADVVNHEDILLVWDKSANQYRPLNFDALVALIPNLVLGAFRNLAYVRRNTFALHQGATAGVVHNTGLVVTDGDTSIELSKDGSTDNGTIAKADFLALPEVAAGTDVLLTPATDHISITLGSVNYLVARVGDDGIWVGADTIDDVANLHINLPGHRLKAYADTLANKLIEFDDVDWDNTGEVEFIKTARGAVQGNIRNGVPFSVSDAKKVAALTMPDHIRAIMEAFADGGWSVSTESGDDLTKKPAIATTLRDNPWTAAAAPSATFAFEFQAGTIVDGGKHGLIRIPTIYAVPVERQRVRVGGNAVFADDNAYASDWVSLLAATLVRTTATYHYYDFVTPTIPAANRIVLENRERFRLNDHVVEVPDVVKAPPEGPVLDYALPEGALFKLTASGTQRNDRLVGRTQTVTGSGAILVSYDLGGGYKLSAYSEHAQFGTGAFLTAPATMLSAANLVTSQAFYLDGYPNMEFDVAQTAFAHSAVNFAVDGLEYADMTGDAWTNEEQGNKAGDPWRSQTAVTAGLQRRSKTGYGAYSFT